VTTEIPPGLTGSQGLSSCTSYNKGFAKTACWTPSWAPCSSTTYLPLQKRVNVME